MPCHKFLKKARLAFAMRVLLTSLPTLAPSLYASLVTKSPDGNVVFTLATDDSGHLNYSIAYRGSAVVASSALGISVDGKDLAGNAALGQPACREINETYPVPGVHSTAVNHANETVIPIKGGPDRLAWTLEIRVFDDGAAYRYRVPGEGKRKIDRELSSWVLPRNATIWYQNDLGSYEGLYSKTTIGEIKPGTIVAFPTTLKLPNNGGYATLTEANLVNYSDMALESNPGNTLKAFFHADSQGWYAGGEILSPWRVTLVASDLNGLVNSDIVHNLCPPPSPELAHADWIQPGRSSWQWWNSGGPKLQEQHQWVDWTKQLGFEYYLIDEGWAGWKSTDGKTAWDEIREITDYARSQGVKIIIWVNSREVFKPEDRKAYFARAKTCGVAGLKIDFPPERECERHQLV